MHMSHEMVCCCASIGDGSSRFPSPDIQADYIHFLPVFPFITVVVVVCLRNKRRDQ